MFLAKNSLRLKAVTLDNINQITKNVKRITHLFYQQ